MHPLIVTLATYSAYRGLARGARSPGNLSRISRVVHRARQKRTAALQLIGWLFIVWRQCSVAIVLAKTPFGRSIYAIGFERDGGASSPGLKVNRTQADHLHALGTCGGRSFPSIIRPSMTTPRRSVGINMGLDVITAVVLGGTSIFGGRGQNPWYHPRRGIDP